MFVDDWLALRASVRAAGVMEPIRLAPVGDQWQIADGRHRAMAAAVEGVECPVRYMHDWGDAELRLGESLMLNLARRHLNPGQRAVVAARLVAQGRVESGPGRARERAAKRLEVSDRSVAMALKVLEARPDLASAIAEGKMRLNEGYVLLRPEGKPPIVGTTVKEITRALRPDPAMTPGTGVEFYTPPAVMDAVHAAWGRPPDYDLSSSLAAQRVVRAVNWCSAPGTDHSGEPGWMGADGLTCDAWNIAATRDARLWGNFPWGREGSMNQFVRLVCELHRKEMLDEALVITPPNVGAEWFNLLTEVATARGDSIERVRFWTEGEGGAESLDSPRHGAFLWWLAPRKRSGAHIQRHLTMFNWWFR